MDGYKPSRATFNSLKPVRLYEPIKVDAAHYPTLDQVMKDLELFKYSMPIKEEKDEHRIAGK